jgi:hypothetical protein
MLPTKFRFIWQSSFREEDFLEINQLETRIAFGGHVFNSDPLINVAATGHSYYLSFFGKLARCQLVCFND